MMPRSLVLKTNALVVVTFIITTLASCPPTTADNATAPVSPPTESVEPIPPTPTEPVIIPPTSPLEALTPSLEDWKEIYRFRFQTGVNFGGPFVLERWINFGVFSGIPDNVGTSQDAFNRGVGDIQQLKNRLQDLWDNYIPECDYAEIASYGLNTIRLPVGYWIIGGKYPDVPMLPPFESFKDAYEGAEEAVHRVFRIAKKYGLGVLLDLHGAPGSQNGADHSGVAGPTLLYGNEQYRRVTVATMKRFAEIYGNHTNLVGIEILNEPRDDGQLQNIYRDSYAAIRGVDNSMPVYICDTVWTSNWNKWADFIINNNWELAAFDVHKYYCFNGGGTPADSYINGIRTWERDTLRNLNARVPVVVGEWSNAFNPGSYDGYDQQRRDGSRRNFFAQQMETMKGSTGSHFWSWHGDWNEVNDWDFRSLIRNGWASANYFPFPSLRCPDKKLSVAEQILNATETEVAAGLTSHQAHWTRTNSTGTYDWEMYKAGFRVGYTLALKFFYFADSKVAWQGQLSAYKAKLYGQSLPAGTSTSNVWQYQDGFSDGIERFNAILNRLS